jgi:hypothetical protein
VAADIDVLQARFDRTERRLRFVQRRCWSGGTQRCALATSAARGTWSLQREGAVVAQGNGVRLDAGTDADVRSAQNGVAVRCPDGAARAFVTTFESDEDASR